LKIPGERFKNHGGRFKNSQRGLKIPGGRFENSQWEI